jgi:DNA polymerase III, delta subunit
MQSGRPIRNCAQEVGLDGGMLSGDAMLDVEYLLAPVGSDRPLVYCYRTGILRPQMKNALREIADRDATYLFGCQPGEIGLVSHSSLLPGIAICDWSKEKASTASALIPEALAALKTSERCSIALFVRYDDALFAHPSWPEAKIYCLLIEEQLVTSETLALALKYLQTTNDLIRSHNLAEQPELQAYFNEIMEEQQSIELPDLIQEFEKTILLNSHLDPGKRLRTVNDGRNRSAILRPLREFVTSKSSYALAELIRGLERKYRDGWRVSELTFELFRVTQKLLNRSDLSARAERAAGYGAMPGHDLAAPVWAATLLAWTDRLLEQDSQLISTPRPDLFLVTVDQLGRDVMRRCSPQMAGDPLVGLWSDIRKAIATSLSDADEPKNQKMKLVSEFATYLSRPETENSRWITRLLGLITTPGDMPGLDLGVTLPNSSGLSEPTALPDPPAFADIVGHKSAVESLRNRFNSHAHSTPVIVFGPDGVGKRTLARVYARALLCEGKLEEGSAPCGRCEACKYFDAGSFGLIEFDAAAVNASAVRELLQDLRYASFSNHRIIIVSNPERAPRIVDTLLKTLEAGFSSTTFLFLVSSLRDLSAAGQSRFAILRLRPLEPYHARRLSNAFLASAGFVCDDDRVLDLIVAEGRGLPGRLQRLCKRVLHAGTGSLHEARRALGLEWVEEAVSYWRALLGEEYQSIRTSEVPPIVACSKATERVRLVLEQLLRFSSARSGGMELAPAFLHLRQDLTDLFHLLEQRAAERELSAAELVSELAQHWTADEYADAAGFEGAGLRSREIILGRLFPADRVACEIRSAYGSLERTSDSTNNA